MEFKISAVSRILLFNEMQENGGGGTLWQTESRGGGGAGATSGQSTPNSPTNVNPYVDTALITATGGLFNGVLGLLIPVYNLRTGKMQMGSFDFVNFNTEVPSKYAYRQEVFMEGRQTTISRIRFRYRDLGKVKVKFSILTDENRDPVKANTVTKTFGGLADNRLRYEYVDKVITGTNPQVYFEREANAGPLCITKLTMITDVEVMEQV